MGLPSWEAIGAFLLAAILSASAWGYETTNENFAVPGTLNYVEGQASIGKEVLTSKSVGSAELQPAQSLDTGNGKAEVLLTPGVFLRVGDKSSVTMISPSLTKTEVGVNKGDAMTEVAEIHPENYIRFTEDGATAQLLKNGLYDFDQKQQEVRVFDGKALVEDGGAKVKIKGGHEVNLASELRSKLLSSTRRPTRKATYTGGATCAPSTSPKQTSMLVSSMRSTDGVRGDRDGGRWMVSGSLV
jgi:hypothetical protein